MDLGLGNIFDFSSEADKPMMPPGEQGGWLQNILPEGPFEAYENAGKMVEDAKAAAGPIVAQTFIHKSLSDLFEGTDVLGVDLITYDAPKGGGWWPDISLTPAGRKWALLAGAALVGFVYLRSR